MVSVADGWMGVDGWTTGVDEFMDEWMDGWMGGWMGERMDGLMERWTTDGWQSWGPDGRLSRFRALVGAVKGYYLVLTAEAVGRCGLVGCRRDETESSTTVAESARCSN